MTTPVSLLILLALASCSVPPQPPTFDESRRHSLNAATEVRLQSCKGELQTARILATEQTTTVEHLRARLAALFARSTLQAEDTRSTIHTIVFPFGATTVALDAADKDALIAQARDAPLIVLSGRTDGTSDTAVESRVARQRAEFVRDVLVGGGIAETRIRTTWQPVGDHAADNGSAAGRALNRRVEIEVHRAAPRPARVDRANAF